MFSRVDQDSTAGISAQISQKNSAGSSQRDLNSQAAMNNVYCLAYIIVRHSDRMGLSVLLHQDFRKRIIVVWSGWAYRRLYGIFISFTHRLTRTAYIYETIWRWMQSTRWVISLWPRTDQSVIDNDLATTRDFTSLWPVNSVSIRSIWSGLIRSNSKAWKVVEGREETQSTMQWICTFEHFENFRSHQLEIKIVFSSQ